MLLIKRTGGKRTVKDGSKENRAKKKKRKGKKALLKCLKRIKAAQIPLAAPVRPQQLGRRAVREGRLANEAQDARRRLEHRVEDDERARAVRTVFEADNCQGVSFKFLVWAVSADTPINRT